MNAEINSRLWIWISIIELVLAVFFWRELALLGDGKTHIVMLDVGQGDSILLRSPSGKQILIDGGPDASALGELGREMPFLDKKIELLVLTHPDLDHIAAFPDILRRYKVERILMTGVEKESSAYAELLALMRQKQIPVLIADHTKDIRIDDELTLDVVWPQEDLLGKRPRDANHYAIVLRAISGSSSILLTADIEKKAEEAILKSGVDIRADIVKVAHHGSRTSSSTGFLLAVDPDLALVSVGRDSRYGHPHPDVVERYRHFGIPLRATAWEGAIEVEME